MLHQAVQVRLYPTALQKALLAQTFGLNLNMANSQFNTLKTSKLLMVMSNFLAILG